MPAVFFFLLFFFSTPELIPQPLNSTGTRSGMYAQHLHTFFAFPLPSVTSTPFIFYFFENTFKARKRSLGPFRDEIERVSPAGLTSLASGRPDREERLGGVEKVQRPAPNKE